MNGIVSEGMLAASRAQVAQANEQRRAPADAWPVSTKAPENNERIERIRPGNNIALPEPPAGGAGHHKKLASWAGATGIPYSHSSGNNSFEGTRGGAASV